MADAALSRLGEFAGLTGPSGATGASGPGQPGYVTGSTAWYGPRATVNNSASTKTLADGVAEFTPMWVSSSITVDRIGILLTTNGGAGSVHRLAIFDDDGSGRPGNLLIDGGTVATASGATVIKTVTISQALSASTWYWLAVAQQGGPSPVGTLRSSTYIMASPPMEWDSSVLLAAPAAYQATGITGGFANGPTITIVSGVAPVTVAVRVV